MTPPTTQEAGLKLVPAEPTGAMEIAGARLHDSYRGTGTVGALNAQRNVKDIYRAMVSAAPSPEPMQADLRETIARIIAPSAFAQVSSRKDGRPTGALKYIGREQNRVRALSKADAILATIPTPEIAKDGPHEIGTHRRGLIRQLWDSKLSDEEAYSVLAYSPALDKPLTERLAAMQAKSEPIGYVHSSVAEGVLGHATVFEDSMAVLHDVPVFAHPSPSTPNPDLAGLVERADRAIELGKRCGADGARVPTNIYVLAEEMLTAIRHLASLK